MAHMDWTGVSNTSESDLSIFGYSFLRGKA